MKTDFHSSMGGDDMLLTDDDEDVFSNDNNFSSFLDELCGTFKG